jgi:putative tryptophan/tyrosine transport system substrate-binding protein
MRGAIMQRREFITLLGGAAAAWPVAAGAQQRGVPVVGFLGLESPEPWAGRLRAYHQGLSEIGYVDGKNVTIEYRWARGNNESVPELAADLVRRQVAVIATFGSALTARAVKSATTTIPVVFQTGGDPVRDGLVASLNRPGGNLTGAASLNAELSPKRLELLHELMPTASNLAMLLDQRGPNFENRSSEMQTAARTLGVQLHILDAGSERDITMAFAKLAALRAGAIVIGGGGFLLSRVGLLAALTLRYGIPSISQDRDLTAAGCLMSYGGNLAESYRLAGVYTGRVLKGEKPADLPVQQVTKVELIINMRTAKVLGLTFPITLLGRADEVIE